MKHILVVLVSLFALCLQNVKAQSSTGVAESDFIDQSIEKGLAFLAAGQLPDGSFPSKFGNTTAIPAFVGMAFLSKGYTPKDPKYGPILNKCIDYIVSKANPNTSYFGDAGNGRMYAHSISTLFLTEVSGMVDRGRQEQIDRVLPKAVKLLLDAQNIRKNPRDEGGWRYTPFSNDSDMSCSGWALMALRSSRLNGANVPGEAIKRAVEYVKRHHDPGQGSFGYQDGKQYANTLTGAGILCLELCGEHNHEYSHRAARFLLRFFKQLSPSSGGNVFYGMYYTAQGLFQIGGDTWKVFQDWMYRTWVPAQSLNGSWKGKGEEESPYYSTAVMILAFTVPYRQLPIYQRDETVDEE